MSDSGKIRISPSDLSKPLNSPTAGSASSGSSPTVRIDRKNASTIRIDLESVLTDGPPRAKPPVQVAPAATTGQAIRVRKDTVQRDLPPTMKANRLIAGQKCPICNGEIQLGQDVRNCHSCKISYHLECWNENRGCGTYGCPNGPGAKERIGTPQIRVVPHESQPPQEPATAAVVAYAAKQPTVSEDGWTGKVIYCSQCGQRIPDQATICIHCGVATGRGPVAVHPTSRLAYILLGLFFGLLGIHNFYAGHTVRGVAQLLITVFTGVFIFPLIVVSIWVLVEICTVSRDGEGRAFT
ncbi:MAG: NINE protein [Candidatus Sumerlaeota bacterium]|nr:NINE protein [Candidatus Sumerlaeota bacterium]